MTSHRLPEITLTPELTAAAADAKAWPFEEAKKILKRYAKAGLPDTVIFETGYGPSGLPHIGTFGEVARTSMVRHAFRILTEDKVKTRLICFSDDLDGMRKIPDNVPDKAALEPYLQMPLSSVPNPFGGEYKSFAEHNNAMLCRFLDTFGFDYEFASATDYYKSGKFDAVLLKAVENAGVEIFTSTPAKRLVIEDGKTTGVIAEDSDGNTLRIAAKAVVLASGGFGNNPDLVEKYSWFSRTAHDMFQCVPTANTGDGLQMALSAGADTASLGALMIIQCARGKTLTSHTSGAGSQPVLWVNRTGRRFASEEVAMSFADAGNTVAKQPGATSYAIIDQDTVAHLQEVGSDIGLGDFIPYHAKLDHLQAELDEDVAAGRAWKGDTIEALAGAVGLDPAVLAATVAEYDEACDEGVDPLFFKPAAFLRPVRTAPFYAIEMTGSVLVSCGGIRVNGNLQVVGKDDAPIPGLYAVGMEASGLYGDTYNLDVPGTANGFAHASGRVAGRHVVSVLAGGAV